MRASQQIAQRSDAMVAACGLDSMSIFFQNRSGARGGLTYLYHNGVSEAAQHAYRHHRVFEEDPFVGAVRPDDRAGQLIWWEDLRGTSPALDAKGYRAFIDCHDVDVVGAWVQQVCRDLYLVIGAHRRPGGHRRSEIGRHRIAHDIAAISQCAGR